MGKMVTAIYNSSDDAKSAVDSLEKEGFSSADVSVIVEESAAREKFSSVPSVGESVAGGAVSGGTAGGVIGGLIGLIAGLSAITIPGLGALLIGGPIAAALGLTGAAATTVTGAVTGAVAGGLLGALTGLGIPEEDARRIEERVKAGDVMVGVKTDDGDVDKAKQVFENNNADNVYVYDLNR